MNKKINFILVFTPFPTEKNISQVIYLKNYLIKGYHLFFVQQPFF